MSTLRRRCASSTSASIPAASAPSASASSPTSTLAPPTAPRAYILENTITHARLLPHPATHAFFYPTLALLLPLAALEAGALDLGRGWLFGYRAESEGNGSGWGVQWRVTGVRAGAYLLPDGARGPEEGEGEDDDEDRAGKGNGLGAETGAGLLKAKLAAVLLQQGCDRARVRAWAASGAEGDAWMLTMPSYLGYEGINPLTVYFCYAVGGALACVVLEIHNTFGEKHVHVLEPGVREDTDGPCSYDHTWTLPRDFHVSPFNDRAGFYTISIAAPPAPSSPLLLAAPPRPKVRIHLRTPTTAPSSTSDCGPAPTIIPDKLKLTATLFTRRATPLTTPNLLRVLARHPFALLLSLARILYHAWILHYLKRLPVFPRPDPKPAAPGWFALSASSTPSSASASLHPADERTYGGIGWQPEGALEAYARRRLETHLAQRGTHVALVSGDPSIPRQLFGDSAGEGPALTIHYAAPRFFSTLLLAPSAEHALLVARAEDLFLTSSDARFCAVLSRHGQCESPTTAKVSLAQRVRVALLPARFVASVPSGCPARHALDGDRPLLNVLVICALHLLDQLERAVFALLRARFVPGMEPWLRWERAADLAVRKGL